MNEFVATTSLGALSKVAVFNWSSYPVAGLLAFSLYKSAVMLAAYRKNNAQGDAEASDRWDNELFLKAVIPLYLRLEQNALETIAVIAQEGDREPSSDTEILRLKESILTRSGIQSFAGMVDFDEALDEIYSNKSRAASLQAKHKANRFCFKLLMVFSFVGLIDFGINLIFISNWVTLSVLFGCMLIVLILWTFVLYNHSHIDNLQYGN